MWPPLCVDDAVHGRQPEPVPCLRLRREERLEDARPRLRRPCPAPVSVTASDHVRPGAGRARPRPPAPDRTLRGRRSSSRPPSGMASRALTTRFTITCSICPGSALTVAQVRRRAPSSARSVSPMQPAEHRLHARRRPAFRSTTCGCSTCLRLKASSCRVSAAACVAGLADLLERRRASSRRSVERLARAARCSR